MSDKKWRLKSKVEVDDETNQPLYWSNVMGWVDKEDATLFTEQEREVYNDSSLIMNSVWTQE